MKNKLLTAILLNISMVISAALVPIFLKWYEQQTGIEPILLSLVFILIGIAGFAVSGYLYISYFDEKDQ